MRWWLFAGALALAGCETKSDDGSADSGGSGDGGDGGGDERLECETTTGAPAGPACVTSTIACGDVIDASTEGGSVAIDSEVYESAFCFIPYNDHDGPERVYAFTMDAQQMTATITLDAPCGDLALAAMRWEDTDICPSGDEHGIAHCEGQPDSDSAENLLYGDGDPDRFLISVDGPAGTSAPFRLSITCDYAR